MLFKLSLRNIKRSVKDYAIYFFTLVLGVAIFYIFNSIESQTAMMETSHVIHELLELMNQIMLGLSVFVAVVLGFLIIYASRFLMKRRKKEFGIYMTLGMSKGKISRILVVETLVIGVISLAIGLLLGIGLSQLLSVFVANLFEADMTKFQFVFSNSAFLSTISAFGVIYLVVMLLNTFSVGRQKLIKLIHSDKVNEKVKARNVFFSAGATILSIVLLGYSYNQVISLGAVNMTTEWLYILIALGSLGTLLFFWGLSGIAMRLLPKLKNFYYKGLNNFVFREINSKINTTVVSMSIICILLFVTIVVFSSAMSMNNTFTADLRDLVPADFQLGKMVNYADETDDPNVVQYSDLTASGFLESQDVNIENDFSEWAEATLYRIDTITYRETIGAKAFASHFNVAESEVGTLLNPTEKFIKASDYNAIAKLYGDEQFELNKDEYIVLVDYDVMAKVRNNALQENQIPITIGNDTLKPKYPEVKIGLIEMATNKVNSGVIIVPDEVDLDGYETYSFFVGNYNANNDDERKQIEQELSDEKITNSPLPITTASKTQLYDQSVGLSAVVTFIGLYLGTIFLITSAALLSLKELSESSDNQEKYILLDKLGVDKNTMNRSLFAQIAIFFCLPLTLAAIHSIFGIIFVNNTILSYVGDSMLSPIVTTAIFVVVIYGGYLLITYFTSKRIVMRRS